MNYNKLRSIGALFFMLALIVSISSCTDDDVWELDDKNITFSEFGVDFEQKGALVAVSDVVNGFYNILVDGPDALVGFTVDDFGAEASAINVYKSLNGGAPVLHTTLTSFPSNVSINLAEAVSGLEEYDNIKLLDEMTYTFDITTADGTFPSGASLNAVIGCPSSLEGDYTTTTTGTSTDGCCSSGPVTVESEVTLTALGGGEYTISDFTANLYFVWYGPDGGDYGIDEAYIAGGGMNATLVDVCDDISSEFTEPFASPATITGSVDPDTGVITYTWKNGFDDTATVVMTPK